MDSLVKHKCVPCEKGGPVATADEIANFKRQVPNWDIVDVQGIQTLKRVFRFKNFMVLHNSQLNAYIFNKTKTLTHRWRSCYENARSFST